MQTWKATEKLFANVGYQWKPTGRKFTLGEQCPLSRITKPKVVPVQQWKPTGRTIPLGEQCPVTRSIASTSAPIFKPQTSMSTKWRMLTTLQALFLKEKKGVRFSARYLRKKRNLLVFYHSYQHDSCFFHARSVIKWINIP
ncbi:hypothetical protein Tco_0150889 [Tanacetum coccineum]